MNQILSDKLRGPLWLFDGPEADLHHGTLTVLHTVEWQQQIRRVHGHAHLVCRPAEAEAMTTDQQPVRACPGPFQLLDAVAATLIRTRRDLPLRLACLLDWQGVTEEGLVTRQVWGAAYYGTPIQPLVNLLQELQVPVPAVQRPVSELFYRGIGHESRRPAVELICLQVALSVPIPIQLP